MPLVKTKTYASLDGRQKLPSNFFGRDYLVLNQNSSISAQPQCAFIKLHWGTQRSMKRERSGFSAGVNQHWHPQSYSEAHQLKLWPTVIRNVQPSLSLVEKLRCGSAEWGVIDIRSKDALLVSFLITPLQAVWSKAVLWCAVHCIALQSTVFPHRQGLWYINHFNGMISKKA